VTLPSNQCLHVVPKLACVSYVASQTLTHHLENTTRDDIFELGGLKNDGPLKLSLIIFFHFLLASFVCVD
jgi:hypothetical protein